MAHKIFLSYTRADQPIVEPVALRLEDIFGQEQVFYDSWSIRPGDGIIDQINKGLEAPEFVFFFVS
ncbi:MAG: TIR domain-containing protein, partial [Candidatus Nephrothrix sp. EaCA]